MSINELQDEVIEEFEALDEWIDRYQLISDYAKELNENPFPEQDRTQQNLIDGCQSKVWFTVRMEDGLMVINGDSDALLVKGIVALFIHVLNRHTPQEIVNADLYFIDRIGLREHLSPMRSNGVAAMLKQLKLYALAYSSKS